MKNEINVSEKEYCGIYEALDEVKDDLRPMSFEDRDIRLAYQHTMEALDIIEDSEESHIIPAAKIMQLIRYAIADLNNILKRNEDAWVIEEKVNMLSDVMADITSLRQA